MKKNFKSRIKKWKIGDYIRQFSIVVGGVLLTTDNNQFQADRTPRDFSKKIADPAFQHWLVTVTQAFDTQFFINYRTRLEKTISKLETTYQ